MKVSYQQAKDIMDRAKTNMVQQDVQQFWKNRRALTHDDKILKSYLHALNLVLGTDYELDLGMDWDYDDATMSE